MRFLGVQRLKGDLGVEEVQAVLQALDGPSVVDKVAGVAARGFLPWVVVWSCGHIRTAIRWSLFEDFSPRLNLNITLDLKTQRGSSFAYFPASILQLWTYVTGGNSRKVGWRLKQLWFLSVSHLTVCTSSPSDSITFESQIVFLALEYSCNMVVVSRVLLKVSSC